MAGGFDEYTFDQAFYLVHQTAGTCGFFSMFLSIFIAVATLLFERKSAQLRLVVWLSISEAMWELFHISDHFYSLSHAGPSPLMPFAQLAPDRVCVMFAFFTQMFTCASWMWSFAIAFSLFRKAVLNKPMVPIWVWHVFCWGTSFILTVVPLGMGHLGISNPFWCHVGFAYPTTLLAVFTIPNYVVFFAIISLYGGIIIYLYRQGKSVNELSGTAMGRYKKVMRKLALFPLVYLFQWTPLFVRTVWVNGYLQPGELSVPLGLDWFVVFTSNLGGTLNFCCYLLRAYPVLLSAIKKRLGMLVSLDSGNTASTRSSSVSIRTDTK